MPTTGADILALGFAPGPHIKAMIQRANELPPGTDLRTALADLAPPPPLPLKEGGGTWIFAEASNSIEQANIDAVRASMDLLARTPVVVATAALPDACPAGEPGTITVGGVAASKMIHPGMHSSDICCSVAITIYKKGVNPKDVLDRFQAATHFGPGGRSDMPAPQHIMEPITAHPILKTFADTADHHFGTQGDGNHFAFVGEIRSTGQTALVTHHGSRGLGAKLYKAGMTIAERHTRRVSPETMGVNAWIDPDTREGEDYWSALQIIRAWTKANHLALHDAVDQPVDDRFWNEHNFVFRKPDGLFYHAKGATPAFRNWAPDATGLTLIPLNMGEPVLIARGLDNPLALGFSPHGAGRNMSRNAHLRLGKHDLVAETKGLDVRFFCGLPDPSELPSAYKSAASIRQQIKDFKLAEIVDEVLPYGSIMAGDWETNAPWRRKKESVDG